MRLSSACVWPPHPLGRTLGQLVGAFGEGDKASLRHGFRLRVSGPVVLLGVFARGVVHTQNS